MWGYIFDRVMYLCAGFVLGKFSRRIEIWWKTRRMVDEVQTSDVTQEAEP